MVLFVLVASCKASTYALAVFTRAVRVQFAAKQMVTWPCDHVHWNLQNLESGLHG